MSSSTAAPILYVVHRVPYPPDKGDRIRTFHLLRFLADRAPVHVACLADEPVEPEIEAALEKYCERVAIVHVKRSRWLWALASFVRGRTVSEGAFYSPGLRRVLRQWGREQQYSVALASASSLAAYFELPELRKVPAVIDLIDVDSEKWLEYAIDSRGCKALLYETEGQRLRRLEQQLPRRFRALTVVSADEASLYRTFSPSGPIHAIPNGVDLDYYQPRPVTDEAGCVFVGALDYRPNVEGTTWFCRQVWPSLHAARPELKLALVGRRPVRAVRELAEVPGVEVVGQVPDVRPYVAQAAVAVAPLQIARGVQNKVLEALAMGKAVVASRQALVGLGAKTGEHLLEASSVAEWVDALSRLLDDTALRSRLGQAGRRYVEEHHCWDRCLQPFAPLLGLTRA